MHSFINCTMPDRYFEMRRSNRCFFSRSAWNICYVWSTKREKDSGGGGYRIISVVISNTFLLSYISNFVEIKRELDCIIAVHFPDHMWTWTGFMLSLCISQPSNWIWSFGMALATDVWAGMCVYLYVLKIHYVFIAFHRHDYRATLLFFLLFPTFWPSHTFVCDTKWKNKHWYTQRVHKISSKRTWSTTMRKTRQLQLVTHRHMQLGWWAWQKSCEITLIIVNYHQAGRSEHCAKAFVCVVCMCENDNNHRKQLFARISITNGLFLATSTCASSLGAFSNVQFFASFVLLRFCTARSSITLQDGRNHHKTTPKNRKRKNIRIVKRKNVIKIHWH